VRELLAITLFLVFSGSVNAAPLGRYDHRFFSLESDSPLFFSNLDSQPVPTYYLQLLGEDLDYLNSEQLGEPETAPRVRVTVQIVTRGIRPVLSPNIKGPTDEEWVIRIIEEGRTTELPGFRAPTLSEVNEDVKDQWIQIVVAGISFEITKVLRRFWETSKFTWTQDARLMLEYVRTIDRQDRNAVHRTRLLGFLNRVLPKIGSNCPSLLRPQGERFSSYLQALWTVQRLTGTQWEGLLPP
jgi:hypothetical protein